jgi:hypothetical protein
LKSRVAAFTALALAAGLLAACESAPITPPPLSPRAPPPPPPPPSPAEEFAWSTVPGNNSLTVTLAYQPAAGQVWGCSGLAEALMPETSYSRSRIAALYGSAERAVQTVGEVRTRSAANPGADYGQFVKTAACDAQNVASFANLPNGAYFIIAQVRPPRPPGAAPEMVIMQRIELSGGQAVRITLPQMAGPAPARPPAR